VVQRRLATLSRAVTPCLSPAGADRATRTPTAALAPLRLPEGVSLTQTIKHRDERGRLLRVEMRATFGVAVAQPTPVHVERRNGVCRDRLNALTRKTHAFAKTATTWDALLDLHVFEQNWLHPHPALRVPAKAMTTGRAYDRRAPAMALGLSDHVWTWREFLTRPTRISS
jgi:hypothetical protein